MALFSGRDRSGSNFDFKGDGSSSAFVLRVGAMSAIPVVTGTQVGVGVTTAQALPSIPANSTHALMTVDTGGGNIRFREDASNPTTSNGLLVQAGSAVELTNLADVRIIATTGTVNVNISYRRYDSAA